MPYAVAGCRTVLLKNVGHIKTINQLQSLVWGGRLESVSLTEAGKDYGLVKFLTAEGCNRFFHDTENGIIVPGDQTKTIIFVERQPGPNSINDLLRNCIEGDATRCVRALDADADWQDHVLLTFARGKNKLKREVDGIKRGKTARGVSIINFEANSTKLTDF
jgi:protein-S-isoprenylcysteine O-methyltransferase